MAAVIGGPDEATRIRGRRFQHERVLLGGRSFERCVFAGCELVFDGRPVQLVDNSFEDCCWSFEDAASCTPNFVTAICREDQGLWTMLGGALGFLDETMRDLPGAKAH
jgi:hypothetical protein